MRPGCRSPARRHLHSPTLLLIQARMTPSQTPSPSTQQSGFYAWYVLALLSLTYVFNFIDRQILAMLMEPIKKEFGVSDTAMGFLSGFAFVFFYSLVGIPIARWADRGSRKRIITLALTIWSGMTAACGLARSFIELAVIRVLVGVGEAGGSPPSHSLITDYFPPHKRATALSIYAWGVYFGSALAFLAGGWLVQHYNWRTAFFVVGLPGLLLATLVAFTVKEVPRGWSEPGHVAPPPTTQPPLGEVLRTLFGRRGFVFVVLASSVQSLAGYAVLTWGPAFLGRVHQMPFVEIGLHLGWTIGIAGCLGAWLGGHLADRMGRHDARWYMRLPAIQSLLGVPFLIGFVLLNDKQHALLCFIPFYALGAMYVGPMFTVIQSGTPPHMRATAAAVLLFIVSLIGSGLGPLSIGLLNDYVFGPIYGATAIRYSMLVMGVLGGFASILFWLGSRDLRKEMATGDGTKHLTA
jgi:MFS family permease